MSSVLVGLASEDAEVSTLSTLLRLVLSLPLVPRFPGRASMPEGTLVALGGDRTGTERGGIELTPLCSDPKVPEHARPAGEPCSISFRSTGKPRTPARLDGLFRTLVDASAGCKHFVLDSQQSCPKPTHPDGRLTLGNSEPVCVLAAGLSTNSSLVSDPLLSRPASKASVTRRCFR